MDKPESNTLGISWHDSQWIPILNQNNILDYFSERSNPFYDRTCNNEVIKMQRLNPDQLVNMTGLEFTLLHAQEPILYVIRKQTRHSPHKLNTLFHLQSAFDKTLSYSKYHPSKGYWWEFKDNEEKEKEEQKKGEKEEEKRRTQLYVPETAGGFTARRAGKEIPTTVCASPQPEVKAEEPKVEPKVEKVEKTEDKSAGNMKPPPEKKAKLR